MTNITYANLITFAKSVGIRFGMVYIVICGMKLEVNDRESGIFVYQFAAIFFKYKHPGISECSGISGGLRKRKFV